jgi:hypothetical protein
LKILDDTLPEFKRKEKLDNEEALEQEVGTCGMYDKHVAIVI